MLRLLCFLGKCVCVCVRAPLLSTPCLMTGMVHLTGPRTHTLLQHQIPITIIALKYLSTSYLLQLRWPTPAPSTSCNLSHPCPHRPLFPFLVLCPCCCRSLSHCCLLLRCPHCSFTVPIFFLGFVIVIIAVFLRGCVCGGEGGCS